MRNRENGFTLIELMIVLVVIGLIYAVVFMSLDHLLSRYRLRGAARDLLATMQLARSEAVSQQQPFRITFDLTGNSFHLDRAPDDADAAPAAAPTTRELGRGIRLERVTLPSSNRTAGEVTVEYTPCGGAPAYQVDLASNDGRKLSIEVNPLNGHARLKD